MLRDSRKRTCQPVKAQDRKYFTVILLMFQMFFVKPERKLLMTNYRLLLNKMLKAHKEEDIKEFSTEEHAIIGLLSRFFGLGKRESIKEFEKAGPTFESCSPNPSCSSISRDTN